MKHSQTKTRKILIVDDEKTIRESLDFFLTANGHQVTTQPDPSFCLSTGRETVSCCRAEACAEVLLVDLRMPFKSGLELLELQARKGCKVPNANKAVISAYISPENFRALEAMGIRCFEKPLLYAHLRDWLEGSPSDGVA